MVKIKPILPLYAVIFFGFLGYGLTITLFIPVLMDTKFAILPANTSMSVRATLSGVLLAAYPFGQFLGSPIIGNLSDHFGRKKTLLYSLAGCSIGFFGMALSLIFHQLVCLFISSFITGLFESNMAISQSVIADCTTNATEKNKLIGYAYSACSLGYMIGPLFGGNVAAYLGYGAPFIVAAFGVVILAAWVSFQFDDKYQPNAHIKINLVKSISSIKTIFNQKNLYKFYIINFLIFFSVQGLYRVVPLYVHDTWKPDLRVFSTLIAYVSTICFLANLLLLHKVSKNFVVHKFLASLIFIGGIIILTIVIPTHFNWIWLTFGLAVIPTVMALPTCTTWLSQQVSATEQGQVLGNNQALLVLGEASSAAIGGLLAGLYIALPVISMGLILIGTSLVAYRHKEKSECTYAKNILEK